MKPKETLFSSRILLFIGIVLFIIIYHKIPFIFFQQDELFGFGLFIKEGWNIVFRGFGVGRIAHFVPFIMSLSYFIFSKFGMNYFLYNSIGLVIHFINGLLIYLIVGKFLRKKFLALIAIVLFFSSNVASQFIMWPVVSINSIALTFSLIIWLMLVDEKMFPKFQGFLRGLVISLFFFLALFSVEYSAGLILFIPSVVLLRKGESIKEKIKILVPFIFTAFIYLLLRFIPILQDHVPVADSQGNILFPIRIVNLVVRYFGQLLIGQSIILSLSKFVQTVMGLSSLGSAYAENFLSPIISEISGIVLFVFSTFVYLRLKEKKPACSSGFLLSVLFIVFSSLPFLLVPEGAGLSSIIASRYMYFGLAGMAIFVTYIFDIFVCSKKKLASYAIALLVFLMVVSGTIANYKRANQLYLQGALRLEILNFIKSKYPVLPDRVVFYTKSDMSYYGLPAEDKILPFQSGLGQTLLVYYQEDENFPKDFFPGDYLWEITSQGYEEAGGRGFGYFRDIESLKKNLNEYNIPKESVIAFSWSGLTNQLTDITVEVRNKLTQ